MASSQLEDLLQHVTRGSQQHQQWSSLAETGEDLIGGIPLTTRSLSTYLRRADTGHSHDDSGPNTARVGGSIGDVGADSSLSPASPLGVVGGGGPQIPEHMNINRLEYFSRCAAIILLPSKGKAIGKLIGKSGSTIAALETEIDGAIKISRKEHLYQGTDDRIICILTKHVSGMLYAYDKIMSVLLEAKLESEQHHLLQQQMHAESAHGGDHRASIVSGKDGDAGVGDEGTAHKESRMQSRFIISDALASAIIGRKGERITTIQQRYGVFIKINNRDDGMTLQRMVTVLTTLPNFHNLVEVGKNFLILSQNQKQFETAFAAMLYNIGYPGKATAFGDEIVTNSFGDTPPPLETMIDALMLQPDEDITKDRTPSLQEKLEVLLDVIHNNPPATGFPTAVTPPRHLDNSLRGSVAFVQNMENAPIMFPPTDQLPGPSDAAAAGGDASIEQSLQRLLSHGATGNGPPLPPPGLFPDSPASQVMTVGALVEDMFFDNIFLDDSIDPNELSRLSSHLVELDVHVPIGRVGRIMGKSGNIVEKISRMTSTIIRVNKEEHDGKRMARISGALQAVVAAVTYIVALIHDINVPFDAGDAVRAVNRKKNRAQTMPAKSSWLYPSNDVAELTASLLVNPATPTDSNSLARRFSDFVVSAEEAVTDSGLTPADSGGRIDFPRFPVASGPDVLSEHRTAPSDGDM